MVYFQNKFTGFDIHHIYIYTFNEGFLEDSETYNFHNQQKMFSVQCFVFT